MGSANSAYSITVSPRWRGRPSVDSTMSHHEPLENGTRAPHAHRPVSAPGSAPGLPNSSGPTIRRSRHKSTLRFWLVYHDTNYHSLRQRRRQGPPVPQSYRCPRRRIAVKGSGRFARALHGDVGGWPPPATGGLSYVRRWRGQCERYPLNVWQGGLTSCVLVASDFRRQSPRRACCWFPRRRPPRWGDLITVVSR